jgi:hypothetical protein
MGARATAIVVAAALSAVAVGVASARHERSTVCTGASAKAILGAFVSAFNAGDQARLDALFVSDARFEWFSSGGPGIRQIPEANDRVSLLAYFATRHALGDRMHVLSVDWNGNTSRRGLSYGNLGFSLRRAAADFDQGGWFNVGGKAAAICTEAGAQFLVMSIGGPDLRPPSCLARVSGRRVCLAELRPCQTKNQAVYRRHGFICGGTYLLYDWKPLLRRPLRVPPITPGSACPMTMPSGSVGARGTTDLPHMDALGVGPSYPTLGYEPGRTFVTLDASDSTGVPGTKVMWSTPRYRGAVLIRGRQLDGPGTLGFDLGPRWTRTVLPEIRLTGPEPAFHPAATYARTPGCYAYQLDTLRSSSLIVFEVRIR